MSRRTALWSAAAFSVVLVLLFGAVLLRPAPDAGAGETSAPTVVVLDQPAEVDGDPLADEGGDDWYADEEHEDDEDEHEEDEEHEDDDD
jgi:hypothetical protein